MHSWYYGWIEKWGERPKRFPAPNCVYCHMPLYAGNASDNLFTMSGADPMTCNERIYFYLAHMSCTTKLSPWQRMETFELIRQTIRKEMQNV